MISINASAKTATEQKYSHCSLDNLLFSSASQLFVGVFVYYPYNKYMILCLLRGIVSDAIQFHNLSW